jgi:hypothetical protein
VFRFAVKVYKHKLLFIVLVSHDSNNISMYLYSYRHHKNAIIAHNNIFFASSLLNRRVAGDSLSCVKRTGGSDIGGNGDGGIGGGGTHVVSASLAADIASVASAASAAKVSKFEASIPGIARSSSVGSVSVDVAVTPSAARLTSAAASAVSSTVTGLTNTVTS